MTPYHGEFILLLCAGLMTPYHRNFIHLLWSTRPMHRMWSLTTPRLFRALCDCYHEEHVPA